MGRRIGPYSLFFVLLLSAPAGAQLIFSDDFESAEPCSWTDLETFCYTEAGIEELLGAFSSLDVCIPAGSYNVAGLATVDYCNDTQCPSGATGCSTTVTFTQLLFDRPSLTADLSATIPTTTIPIDAGFLGSCDVTLSNFSGNIMGMASTMNYSCIDEDILSGVSGVDLSYSVDIDYSGDFLVCFGVEAAEGELKGFVEDEIKALIQQEVEAVIAGAWVCAETPPAFRARSLRLLH